MDFTLATLPLGDSRIPDWTDGTATEIGRNRPHDSGGYAPPVAFSCFRPQNQWQGDGWGTHSGIFLRVRDKSFRIPVSVFPRCFDRLGCRSCEGSVWTIVAPRTRSGRNRTSGAKAIRSSSPGRGPSRFRPPAGDFSPAGRPGSSCPCGMPRGQAPPPGRTRSGPPGG